MYFLAMACNGTSFTKLKVWPIDLKLTPSSPTKRTTRSLADLGTRLRELEITPDLVQTYA